MIASRPRLAFISPLFLFPNDAGGKIRTTNILRGLKGGAFDVTLIGPATAHQQHEWADRIQEVCDRFIPWHAPLSRPRWRRALDLLGELPVNVAADSTRAGRAAVRDALQRDRYDIAVFDFVHSAVLRPRDAGVASICFTHNVEAEIFARHAQQAKAPLMRRIWASQAAKMERYESRELRQFSAVIAVSERDAEYFRARYGVATVSIIPTGVDLDFFSWAEPGEMSGAVPPTAVFAGSMDSAANIDGVEYFLGDIWPRVRSRIPTARFVVVGRRPPAGLVERGKRLPGVSFTGFVDDVRPFVHAAHAFVIPLRVGGGTRIKAFEGMALGCPVVSTSIGIEGLAVNDGEHFLRADSAEDFAAHVASLLEDAELRRTLSRQARTCVEDRFGHRVAAQVFEDICLANLRPPRLDQRAPCSQTLASSG